MKVGIIVHSHTGNTISVAEKLRDLLLSAGHSVNLERVTAVNENPSARGNIQLQSTPDISEYEALIFCAPVRAFSLSPIMRMYLSQLPSLQGKKVSGFVTQHFPYPWMGGNRAISQMKESCTSKGTQMDATGIVNWSNKQREKMIDDILVKLGGF
jgi:multimeric flavodoxin WrbA